MLLFGKQDAAEEHRQLALRLGDYTRKEYDARASIEHLLEAIKLKPGEFRYHFDLGRTYLLLPEIAVIRGATLPFRLAESPSRALAEFQETARLNPKFDPTYLNLAHCYIILGEKEKAVATYEEYLRLRKHSPDKAADHLQNLEYALQKRTKLEAKPAESEQHLRQAIFHRSEGKYRQAEKELEKARAIAPDFAWFYRLIFRLTG